MSWKNRVQDDLNRIRRFKERQDEVRWGPAYRAAIQAVRGEVPTLSGSGTLPSIPLQRDIHAMSWPEKVAIALALYANPLDVHEQHVYYSTPISHPLAFHPKYAHLTWPVTEGTFSLAEQLGVEDFHPRAWKKAEHNASGDTAEQDEQLLGEWRIGFYIGDLMLHMRAPSRGARPYTRIWEVKEHEEDHGKPGGLKIRRFNAKEVERAEARRLVTAAYAAQLGMQVTEFSLDLVPKPLAASLVTLCRAQAIDYSLPPTAVGELLEAFQEAIGQDTPPRTIALRLLNTAEQVEQAKILLEHAVWERKVRVDLSEILAWNLPLLPERVDLLSHYHELFAPEKEVMK